MRQKGDTIVEVIFGFTIFSLVAVGGLSLMNRGAAIAQQSLEISLVRDQMDSQVDALRYAHDAYIANYGQTGTDSEKVWNKIVGTNSVGSGAQPFENMASNQKCTLPSAGENPPFALDIRKLDGENDSTPVLQFSSSPSTVDVPVSDTSGAGSRDDFSSTTYAQVRYSYADGTPLATAISQGVWIQSIKQPTIDGKQPGYYDFHIRACWLSPGQAIPVTLGTIVRFYDPAL